jgi:hypothetical protein
MSEGGKYMPGDGEPVFGYTLGERYGSEDMYRDMGIERPPLPGGTVWVDGVAGVTIEIGEGE